MQRTWQLWAVAVFSMVFLHCGCDSKTGTRRPKFEILVDDGTDERTLVDFGLVQVELTHTQTFRVRNNGSADLTLTEAKTAAPFGVGSTLPLIIPAGDEARFAVTFTPTLVDQRVTAQLTLESSDVSRPSATLELAGTGVKAVAKVTPSPIAFGNVYVGETKKVTVSLSNAGTQALNVQGAALSSSVAQVTGDLTALKTSLAPGATVSAELTFAPTAPQPVTGDLELTLEASQGGLLKVPLTAQGVVADPRLCFKFDDTGVEQCTDGASANLNIDFGSFCDPDVFGTDGGPLACPTVNGRSGQLRVRNEGNWPVSYAMTIDPHPLPGSPCKDAGFATRTDFRFSVVPDGGTAKWPLPVEQLPAQLTDTKPWASQPIAITYQPSSRCGAEGSDQATVLWSRRGDPVGTNRAPSIFFVTLGGKSKLPHGEPSTFACGSATTMATVPCVDDFFGVANTGDAPLVVVGVDLWEEVFTPGVDGGGPNGGTLQPCDFGNPASHCTRFAWAATDGGDPNQYAPHIIPAAVNSNTPSQQVLGRLVFGPHGAGCAIDGGACSGSTYRIYAKVRTADPYEPEVFTQVSGSAL